MSLKRYWQTFERRFLTQKTIDTPSVILLWWGSYGYRGGPTIGDLMAVENLSAGLSSRGIDHAIISHPELEFPGHLAVSNLYAIRPVKKLAFVCGPLTYGHELADLLSVQSQATKIAVGVSVLANQERMNRRFDWIVARDGIQPSYFDLAIFETKEPHPGRRFETVGVCLRGPQGEYGQGRKALADEAEVAIRSLVATDKLRPIEIDTILSRSNGPAAILSQFEACDIVFTTRMHGALLALAEGKPVLAIDQIRGGAKVAAVVGKTGWPFVLNAADLSDNTLNGSLERLQQHDWASEIRTAQARMLFLTQEALEASVSCIAT